MASGKLSFRDLYHHICLISLNDGLRCITENFPHASTATHILTYCYVDHTAGLTFEVLACVKQNGQGQMEVSEGTPSVSAKCRYGSLTDCSLWVTDFPALQKAFAAQIQRIQKSYTPNAQIASLRDAVELDAFRHPEFPDDILVMLFRQGLQPEGCWVRCESFDQNGFYGILLNEPDFDFGVHSGDAVSFSPTEVDGDILCARLCD